MSKSIQEADLEATDMAFSSHHAWFLWCQLWELFPSYADKVEKLALRFIDSWVKAAKATEGVYLHLLVAHFPDVIRKYGDLGLRQTEGLEHCHKVRKEVGRRATNRKPIPPTDPADDRA